MLAVGWLALLLLPLAGFWLLIAAPSADVHWEDHPAHFWLVLGTALTSAALAYATGGVARRRGDGLLWTSDGPRNRLEYQAFSSG